MTSFVQMERTKIYLKYQTYAFPIERMNFFDVNSTPSMLKTNVLHMYTPNWLQKYL